MLWYPELDRPRLRPVEAIPAEHRDEPLIVLRDPAGLAAEGVAVPLPVYALLTLMDGRRTVAEIAAAFRAHFGVAVPPERLNQIVLQLDEARLLDTEHFRRHRQARLDAYRGAPARPLSRAVDGLPTEPAPFREMMNRHFMQPGGPGRLPAPGSRPEVKVLVAPHIDFARGGANYGWSYQSLGDGPSPETVVILGTSHAPCAFPFAATRQHFETPLGVVECERAFLDALQGRVAFDLCAEELLHASEHSVEFQVLMLKHVFPEAPGLRIVPLLCGALRGDAAAGGAVSPEFEAAVDALVATIAAWPRRVTVIAGADLAHVGPHFGDEEEVSEAMLAAVRAQDLEALRLAAAGDARGFVQSFEATGNARRVCSVACLYTALRCLPALGVERGRLLNYVQSVHPSRQLAVTHASLAFP